MEIEQAYIVSDVVIIVEKLRKIGYKIAWQEKQFNTYFDHSNYSLLKNQKYLRLRQSDVVIKYGQNMIEKNYEFTFNSRDFTKDKIERRSGIGWATGVDEVSQFAFLFRGIGLINSFNLHKCRYEYSIVPTNVNYKNQLHVEIDTNIVIKPYPNYEEDMLILEDTIQICIETNGNNKEPKIIYEDAKSRMQKLCKKLNLKESDVLKKNYFERFLEKCPMWKEQYYL